MNDSTVKGVAEFLLKEQEHKIALEKEATATRLEYYIPTTMKGRISTFIAILSIIVLGVIAFRNGDELFFIGMTAFISLCSEINRLERKTIAMQKLYDRKKFQNQTLQETGTVPRDD